MIERLRATEPSIPSDAHVGDLPAGGETTISDARIQEILARLGVILHDQIAQANTFSRHGAGYDHRLAQPMDDIELAGWKSVFGIDKVVEDAVNERSLFVVNIDGEPEALPAAPSGNGGLVRPYTREPMQWATEQDSSGDTVRVNYGEQTHGIPQAHWIPRRLLTLVESTDDLTYLIKPGIHFGGRTTTAGHLYNAFVSLDTYIQAKNGTQLVSKIPGTGIPGTVTSKPVYHPHRAVQTSLWMNTSLEENEPNSLSIRRVGRPEALILSCAIQDIATLPQLEVPESDKLRMWFWQLDRLISDQRLALPAAPSTQLEAN